MPRAVASSALRSTATPVWGKGSSAAVMSVDPLPNDDRDPFLLHYSDWPLQGHFQEVYLVAAEMAKNDPPLFTPLVSAEDRRNALQLYKGKCLNCLGEDHSFKSCTRGFVNATGLLNNDIKLHMEKDPALWSRWQKRMATYRRAGRNIQRNNFSGRTRRTSDKPDTNKPSHTQSSSDSATSAKKGWKGKKLSLIHI